MSPAAQTEGTEVSRYSFVKTPLFNESPESFKCARSMWIPIPTPTRSALTSVPLSVLTEVNLPSPTNSLTCVS